MRFTNKHIIVFLLNCIVVASTALLLYAQDSNTQDSLEKAFRQAKPWAISKIANKGESVIPQMLRGLESTNPSYRYACRKVLYSLWDRLTPEKRKKAASGQLAANIVSVKKENNDNTILFILEFSCNVPGPMTIYGREIGLLVNDKYVATFEEEESTEFSVYPNRLFQTTLRLHVKNNQPVMLPGDRIEIIGHSWFGAKVNIPENNIMSQDDKLDIGAFGVTWQTPAKGYK